MSGFLNSYRLLAGVLVPCMLLAGCGTMQPGVEAAPESVVAPEPQKVAVAPAVVQGIPPRQPSETENLISYFTQLRKLHGPELAREHDAARQAYGRARSEYNGMRLAMVVAVPNTPFADDPRALDLLDPIARNADSRLSALAALLVAQIQERRRLDANAQALQQKLDALKSLERSLIDRKR
jgi:hypothetical protein